MRFCIEEADLDTLGGEERRIIERDADVFRDLSYLSDEEAAKTIADDHIDVLLSCMIMRYMSRW